MRRIVEVSIGTVIDGELRQASAEVDVPDGTPWEAAADLAAAFGAAYARLWAVPLDTVQASATVIETERTIVRHADVRCGSRALSRGD